MICPVCKGIQLPHFPGSSGGWIDENYIFSGIECGACNGTGYVDEPDLTKNYKGGINMENEEEIGKVMHYFAKPQVAWIKLSGNIHFGDKIHIKGATTDFTCTVQSLRNDDDVDVQLMSAGEEAGIKVPDKVREHDTVFKIG